MAHNLRMRIAENLSELDIFPPYPPCPGQRKQSINIVKSEEKNVSFFLFTSLSEKRYHLYARLALLALLITDAPLFVSLFPQGGGGGGGGGLLFIFFLNTLNCPLCPSSSPPFHRSTRLWTLDNYLAKCPRRGPEKTQDLREFKYSFYLVPILGWSSENYHQTAPCILQYLWKG